MNFDVVSFADERGLVVSEEILATAESVHCQLRPQLAGRYLSTMIRVLNDSAEMCAVIEGGNVAGLAVFRVYENTFQGKHLYIDDLITDEALRSRGIGRLILNHLTHIAQARGCGALTLDSGTQRARAHAFYFREGFTITSFHFVKPL